MRKEKGIFLDFSNTITTVESENLAIEKWLSFIREKYGLDQGIYEKFINMRLKKLVERESNFRTFMQINKEVLKEIYGIDEIYEEEYYSFHERFLRLRDDFKEFLEKVREQFIVVVVTDADNTYTERTLSSLGIYGSFDLIVTAEDVRAPKPDRRIFEEALRRSGYPKKVVFIGDSERRDIQGAKKMNFLVIKMEDHSGETGADFVVKNFSQVIDILKSSGLLQ
ncbi:MAG: HAD family hydrolase [Thermoplasmata archaeon]